MYHISCITYIYIVYYNILYYIISYYIILYVAYFCILYIVYCILCIVYVYMSTTLWQFVTVCHGCRGPFASMILHRWCSNAWPDGNPISMIAICYWPIFQYIHVYPCIYIYPHDPSLSIACGLLPWFLNCLFGSEPFFLDTAVAFDFERSPNLSVYQPTIYLVSPHVWPGQRIWNCPENDFLTSWWPGKPKWVWPVWPGKNLHSVQAAWWKMAPSCGYNQFLCDGHEAIWGGP